MNRYWNRLRYRLEHVPTASVHSPAESDEFVTVSYVTTAPRRRDFLRVLRGQWTPVVSRVRRLTLKGMDRELKAVWTSDAMTHALYDASIFSAFDKAEPASGTVEYIAAPDAGENR